MSRTESSLWRELEDLRPLGDVDGALARGREIESGGRRRLRWLAAAAAAAAVVAVVGVSAWWSPEQPAAPAGDVGPPDAAPAIEISERIAEWVPGSSEVGTLAPVGTAVARQCRETCRHLLVRADGETIPVREVSPGLAAALDGADQVSLSFDARWIAIATGGAVRLFSLVPGESVPLVFEPSTPSYRWQLTWWDVSSRGAVLAEQDGTGAPVSHGRANLARRVTKERAVQGGPRDVGRLTTVDQVGHTYDLAEQMGPAETLAGPDGGTELTAPVGVDSARLQMTVFEDGRRTGLIEIGPDGPERLEYAEVEGWQLLGAIRPDEAALTTDRDGRSLVKGHSAAGIEWQHELRGDVTWYLPGLRP